MADTERPDDTDGKAMTVEAHFATRPRVEVSRTSKGAYSWRVCVVATDNSPDALLAASALALRTNTDLERALR